LNNQYYHFNHLNRLKHHVDFSDLADSNQGNTLEWLDFAIDRNDLNQLKQPSRFADVELKTNHKGQTKNFFIQGLYLYPKTAQSTRTGDVWHTSEGEGEFSDSKLQVYYFTYESPNLFIKNPDINSRIYEAPNAMTPSCFSVLQYSTLQTHSKGQNTFPSKFH